MFESCLRMKKLEALVSRPSGWLTSNAMINRPGSLQVEAQVDNPSKGLKKKKYRAAGQKRTQVPRPSNYRCFLVVFRYLKASRKHLLEGLGTFCRETRPPYCSLFCTRF